MSAFISALDTHLSRLEALDEGVTKDQIKSIHYPSNETLINLIANAEPTVEKISKEIISADAANDIQTVSLYEDLLSLYVSARGAMGEYLSNTDAIVNGSVENISIRDLKQYTYTTLLKIKKLNINQI